MARAPYTREDYRSVSARVADENVAAKGSAAKSTMRTFVLVRDEDVSGTSGLGIVAEGVEWSNGTVSIHWMSQYETHSTYANMKVLEQVHGHGGRTRVEWKS